MKLYRNTEHNFATILCVVITTLAYTMIMVAACTIT